MMSIFGIGFRIVLLGLAVLLERLGSFVRAFFGSQAFPPSEDEAV